MNETNDPLDDAFAEQLKALVPASMPGGQRSDDQPALASMLYQAGYQAGREQHVHRLAASRHTTTWFSIVAASLLTAILTMPVAYRVGQRSLETDSGVIGSGVIAGGEEVNQQGTVDPAAASRAEVQRVNERTGKPGESPSPIAPKLDSENTPASFAVTPFDFKQLARLWQPAWKLREPSADTLTAFHGASLEDLPRSAWTFAPDDPMLPRETLSAGDLADFTLGLEVNHR
ncbi:hypothetical protein Enr13x_17340 [Stieleria neptunia]|uniref:Uncharacterized protein n=1 Tax=Stieleria neptunia TaxID=2527979 RepID=A0A518HM06_9BACT|nr:hypothetical protein [Stieleria neptunia]QDV41891.1 hypothetical protein Enr13x_17340 [Stieleria neptunia]